MYKNYFKIAIEHPGEKKNIPNNEKWTDLFRILHFFVKELLQKMLIKEDKIRYLIIVKKEKKRKNLYQAF